MEWNVRLRNARIQSRMTQEQLAKKLNIGRSTLANYERGNRKPTFIELKNIAKVLNVDVNYLVESSESSADVEFVSQAIYVFNDLNISEADKDAIFQDVMKIYLKGKENDRARSLR